MQYRRFGQTELNFSVFSLGTMRSLVNPDNFRQTLEAAFELGINHIETARGYGKSELYIGSSLKELGYKRADFYITSKIPPTSEPHKIRAWLEESLSLLQLEYLDCLAIHGINTWEHLDWVKQDCMPVLDALRKEGFFNHLGFSTHGPLDLILSAIDTGYFSFLNLHYYYFFQHNQPAIELAKARDLGIFIISPADKGGLLHQPSELLKELCHPLTPLEFNYLFLLEDPAISTLSFGPASPLETKIPSLDQYSSQNCMAIARRLEAQLQKRLSTDLCSQCYQCLPCPENINIPEVLRLRNLALAFDMQQYAQYRYGMFEKAGHWFPGKKANNCSQCGDCLPRCPEQLKIPDLLFDAHNTLNVGESRRLWENEN